ncbi:MAG: glycoside hydrolase family 15 protein [bacterium]|nr:glycoside hydrolase family 15 protein [bacterium]MDZ4284958.1 glycoside hydrolase family 15 protein [Patescibacteria group bacterium]
MSEITDTTHTKTEIAAHLGILRSLETPSGLFFASAKGVSTGYDKAWLRDNFYTSLAFEAAEEWETVARCSRAVLDIFLKHEEKISWAARERPHASYQYIHARYHPETFEEFWDEWGNKQNDAVGAVLFKLGDLKRQGRGVVATADDRRIVQKLVDYLVSIEYWHDPDNGMWEEQEEVHASSIGACVAGLRKVREAFPFITVPQGTIERGGEALRALLPRESASKFCDLALLSLFYPYNLLEGAVADEILNNLEYHLSRERGVVRYKTDRYYNKNADGWSEEAEWTMGFPWLAIVHARRGARERAAEYLDRARAVLTTNGMLPELYHSNATTPNENIPLAWAESLFVAALIECARLR